MKKNYMILAILLAATINGIAQKKSPTNKGNKMYGFAVLLTDSDLYGAYTDISLD